MTALDIEMPVLPDDAPHILVVDDDERIRDLLSSYLRQNGLRVTQAEDGAAARSRLEGLSFD
jgi:two-component system, OmpR family, phosphate regulon response regulator OmpR